MNHHIGLVPAMVLTPRIDQINQYLAEQRQQVELSMHHVHHASHQNHQNHHMHRDSDMRDQSFRDRERRVERREPRDRERKRDSRREDHSRSRERSRERSRRTYDNGFQGSQFGHEAGFEDSQGSYDGSESRYSNHSGPNDDYYGHTSDHSFDQRSQDSDDFIEQSRDRSKDSRDRDRDSRDRDRDDRERSRGSRERDRDRDSSRQEKGGEKWMTETPTNTILLRGLPSEVDENDIRAELMMFGAPIKEVRLMKRKDTGVSRGFAFVEFQNLKDAQRWMELNQGQMRLLNQYTINMYYSTPKTGTPGVDARSQDNWTRSDWTCSKCGAHNFKRRDYCFKCSIPKEESERAKAGDGFDQVGNNPCNTLIFRGLDALTMEENIIAALAKVTNLPVKNIKVIRDDLTGTSQGFGFLEMNTLADSTAVLDVIKNQGSALEVDGKAILVSYAKNTFSTVMATMKQTWTNSAGQTWDYSQPEYSTYYQQTGATGVETAAGGQWTYDPNTGQYYDAVTGQWYDHSAYYEQTQGSSTQSDTTNAAAAVAQAAIQHAQAKQYSKDDIPLAKSTGKESTTLQLTATTTAAVATTAVVAGSTTATAAPSATVHVPGTPTALPTYPVPDVSTYQYDESSGYYYDPTTTLYYDPNSQYYYNSTTGQFLYWDGDRQTYLPAPLDGTTTQPLIDGSPDDRRPDEKSKKDKEKKEKVKIAKKIAKDMEKWAKSMNAQKECARDGGRGGRTEEKESPSADAGYAILEKRATMTDNRKGIDINLLMNKDDKKLMPPPGASRAQQQSPGTLVASYGGDSEEEEDDESGLLDENKLLDLSKMACLLCKRQFPNREALTRHTQLSDLHKNNIEELRKQKANRSIQYRDRAKERRAKYGVTDPPVPRRRDESVPVPYEEPTKAGLKEDNIGNKLLQKMGWSQGQGLGRANQGIVDPVQATHRQMGAGLGARGSSYQVSPGDSYKDSVKKVMYQRFQELE